MRNSEKNVRVAPEKNGAYHHGDLRKALIQAALELAAESHNWEFSLREVARRAGVSHNAPYNHFAHKRELLSAAAAAGHELLRDALRAAVAKVNDPRRALVKMGMAYMKFGVENASLYRLMFSASLSGPDWRPTEVIEAGVTTKALLEDILLRGVRDGVFATSLSRKSELQSVTLTAWAAVHGITTFAIDGLVDLEQVSIERLAEKIAQLTQRTEAKKH